MTLIRTFFVHKPSSRHLYVTFYFHNFRLSHVKPPTFSGESVKMPRLVTVHSKVTKNPRRPYEKERLDQVRSSFIKR